MEQSYSSPDNLAGTDQPARNPAELAAVQRGYRNLAQVPGEDNVGGVEALWYTPASNLVAGSFPAQGPLAIEQLQLVEGAMWYQLVSVRGSVELEQKSKPYGRHGTGFAPRLTGSLARHTPELAVGFEAMEGGRFVVLYRDLNGQVQLVGTPDQPLEWQDSYSAGTETKRNGYDWSLSGEAPRRARPYRGTWQVADVGMLSVGAGGSVEVRAADGAYVGTYPAGSVIVLPAQVGGDMAFNWSRPITAPVPGLQGRTVGGLTVSAGLENMLFEPEGPTATLGISPQNLDYDVAEEQEIDIFYSAVRRGAALTELTVAGRNIPLVAHGNVVAGSSTGGDFSVFVEGNVNKTFSMIVRDAAGKTAQQSQTLTFWHRRYLFASSTDLVALLDDDEQTAVSQAILAATAGERSTERGLATSATLAAQRLYYILPEVWGMPGLSVNGLPNNDITSRVFDMTTATGYTLRARLVATSIGNSTYNFLFS